ncbi:hypothetical protein AYI69_g8016 [Smittium culicis]|uniref:Uncharacterized protein n=1 Tax=Smittium culicis TaxID=133412 RepID=A0A1R1XMW2_9FUNG|nr:hypothetical protein AYI69_g8016 [Smittium culicis]
MSLLISGCESCIVEGYLLIGYQLDQTAGIAVNICDQFFEKAQENSLDSVNPALNNFNSDLFILYSTISRITYDLEIEKIRSVYSLLVND